MNLLDRLRVAASAAIEEAQFTLPLLRRMVVEQRRRLRITISETSGRVRPAVGEVAQEVSVVAFSVDEEANATLQVLNQTRIRPFREALGAESTTSSLTCFKERQPAASSPKPVIDRIAGSVTKRNISRFVVHA